MVPIAQSFLNVDRNVLALYRLDGEWFVFSWNDTSVKETIDAICRDEGLTACEKTRLLVRLLRGLRR